MSNLTRWIQECLLRLDQPYWRFVARHPSLHSHLSNLHCLLRWLT